MKITNSIGQPFSLVAGKGLGLGGTSYERLGSFLPQRNFGQAQLNCGVNLVNSNVFFQDRILQFPSLNGVVSLSYIYNSLVGWHLGYGRHLKSINSKLLKITEVDGHEVDYVYDENKQAYTATAYQDSLPIIKRDQKSKCWVWYDPKTRITNYFNDQGLLIQQFDSAGNLTEFKYNKYNQPSSIHIDNGTVVELRRPTENTIEIFAKQSPDVPFQLVQHYELTKGQLKKSTTYDNYSVLYAYDDKQKLKTVVQSDKSKLQFKFIQNQLEQIQVGDEQPQYFNFGKEKNIFTDTAGCISVFNQDPNKYHFVSSNSDISIEYTTKGQVRRIWQYQDKAHLEQFFYDEKTGLIKKYINRNGDVTEFQYAEGEIPYLLAETSYSDNEGPYTTRFVYQLLKDKYPVLRFKISPEGRVKEYIFNESNGLLETKRKYLRDFFPKSRVATFLELNNWSKDIPSEAISEIVYRHDKQGRIESIEHDVSKQSFQNYDLWGNAKDQAVVIDEGKKVASHSDHDSLNRIRQNIKGVGLPIQQKLQREFKSNIIETTYPNFTKEIAYIAPDGLVDKKTTDVPRECAGSSIISPKPINEAYKYDSKNHAKITILPGKRQITEFFDDKDRLKISINPGGFAQTFEYNDKYRFQIHRQYAQKIKLTSLSDKAIVEQYLADHKKDSDNRTTYQFFNLQGELQYEIDAEGYLIEHQYNLAKKPTSTIQYQQKILPKELELLLNGKSIERTPDRVVDRVTTQFYDNDGYKFAEQDTAGYITEFIHDAGGRITDEIHYAEPVQKLLKNFVRPKASEHDAHYYYFYNRLNQCILEVNPRGFITTHTYYDDGKIKLSKAYDKAVDPAWYQHTKVKPTAVATPNKDQTKSYKYDDLRRVSEIEYSSGKVEQYKYDEMNNVIASYSRDAQHMNEASGDYCRGFETTFDKLGQPIAHVNPYIAQKLAEIDLENLDEQKTKQKKGDILKSAERNIFDDAGLKIRSIDPFGNVTRYFYDQEHRPILTIDPSGIIQEKKLNAFGEAIKTRCYYKLYPKTMDKLDGGVLDHDMLSIIHTLKSTKDRITKYQRDHRGLITQKINPKASVSEFEYTAFKQCQFEKIDIVDKKPQLIIGHKYESRGFEIETTKTSSTGKTIKTQKQHHHYMGLVTKTIDEIGGETDYQRDNLGNAEEIRKKITDSGEFIVTEKNKYDGFSRPIEKTNADNEKLCIEYNEITRTRTLSHPNEDSKTVIQENIFGETVATSVEKAGVLIQKTTETHAPDGQVLTHKNGLGKGTTFTYDLLGQKRSETDANQKKTTFKPNASGQIVKMIVDDQPDGLKLKTIFKPNAFGENETIVDARRTMIKNEFDLCGNLETTTRDMGDEKAKLVLKQVYNAQQSLTDIIKGDSVTLDQYHEKQVYDDFNRIQETIIDPGGLNISRKSEYDDAGNVIKSIDPNGHITRRFFNLRQQKRFEVKEVNDHEVSVIEYQYTDAGKLKSIRTYDKPVPKEAINDDTTLKTLPLFTKSNEDTVTQYFYDTHGRERFKLKLLYDPVKGKFEGIVEERQYDAADREIKYVRYKNLVDVNDYKTLTTDLLAQQVEKIASEEDRILYRWYDEASQERIIVDQDGAIFEKKYDDAGHIIQEIHYSHAIPNPANLLATHFDALPIKHDPNRDRIKSYVYDSCGREHFIVQPNGEVIRKDYDENNNVVRLYKFEKAIDVTTTYEALVATVNALQPNEAVDAITITEFDKADQIEKVTDALNHADNFKRDALGRVHVHTDRGGQEWEYCYDRANRLREEYSPETDITIVKREHDLKLKEKTITTRVKKETIFDNADNATQIIEGQGFEDARTFYLEYSPHNKPNKTGLINCEINDPNNKEALLNPDLSSLPTKETVLGTEIIYNTKGKKIAEKNEAGIWNYYVYDSAERLVYEIHNQQRVTHYSRNSFGEVEEERTYETPIQLDLKTLKPQELTPSVIAKAVVLKDGDRVTTTRYNRSGKPTSVTQSNVFYYDDGQYGFAQPEKRFDYNSFGDCVYEGTLIRPGKWAEKYFWPDKCSRIIGTVDENKYYTFFERNANGTVHKQFEYADPLAISLSVKSAKELLIEDLNEKAKSTAKNRIYEFGYDQLEQKISEKILKVLVDRLKISTNKDGKEIADFETIEVPALEKQWTYTPTQLISSMTHENGTKEYKYYDVRGLLKGETAVSRTSLNGKKITPLSVYKVNAFGQVVVTERSTEGCNEPTLNQFPAFLSKDKIIQDMTRFDNRGLAQYTQDANGNLVARTFTPTRQIARILTPTTIWSPADKSLFNDFVLIGKEQGPDGLKQELANAPDAFSKTKYLAEKRFDYDIFDQPLCVSLLKENKPQDTHYYKNNIFGEVVSEGNTNIDWPLFRKLDGRGVEWSNNANKDSPAIKLYDLRGFETMELQAMDNDLSKIKYEELSSLLTCDVNKLDRNEKILDLAGRAIALKSPKWFHLSSALPTRGYQYDRWSNIVVSTDSRGYKTENKYNHYNKLIKCIKPETTVLTDGGEFRANPITDYGYDARGFNIAVRNPNNGVNWYRLDEAEQCIEEILPSGVRCNRREIDALGLIQTQMDDRGEIWAYRNDNLGNVLKITPPSNTATLQFEYDEQQNRITTIDHEGNYQRYIYDLSNNIIERYMPLGQCTYNEYDHNHLLLSTYNSVDKAMLRWERDYFGNLLSHTDLMQQTYQYKYNYRKQLIHKYLNSQQTRYQIQPEIVRVKMSELGLDLGNSYSYRIVGVPGQNIEYKYEADEVIDIKDHSLDQHIGYARDGENRPLLKGIEKISNGKFIASYEADYDELGRDSHCKQQVYSLRGSLNQLIYDVKYDANDNCKNVVDVLMPGGYSSICYSPPHKHDYHYGYDIDDHVNLFTGPNTIYNYIYKNGFRKHEQLNLSGNIYETDIEYHPDGPIHFANSNNIFNMTSKLNSRGLLSEYTESYPNYNSVYIPGYNENGWLQTTYYKENNNNYFKDHTAYLESGTLYKTFSGEGLPWTDTTTTTMDKAEENCEDNLRYSYFGTDHWMPSTVSGTRFWQNRATDGKTPEMTAQMFHDSNGMINGKMCAADEPESVLDNPILIKFPYLNTYHPFIVPDSISYFETTAEGQILRKQHLPSMPEVNYINEADGFEFFDDINGKLLGGYKSEYNNINELGDEHYHHLGQGSEIYPAGDFVIFNATHPIANYLPTNKSAKNDPLSFDKPKMPQGLQTYIVQPGDTFASISEKQYGDARYGDQIAISNGFIEEFVPRPGYILNLPHVVPHYNKATNHTPYDQFVSLISGHLSPHFHSIHSIVASERHRSRAWLGSLAKIIALAVLLYVAPYAAMLLLKTAVGVAFTGGVLGTAEVGLSHSVLTGVLAGIGDAAAQGLAIKLDAQDHFSFNEMFETGLSAGVLCNFGSPHSLLDAAKEAAAIGATAATAQLLEMQAGTRDKFDVKAIGLQVAAASASMGINKGFDKVFGTNEVSGMAAGVTTSVTQSAMNSVAYGAPLDVSQMAINAVGSIMGHAVGDKAANGLRRPVIDTSSHEIAETEAALQVQVPEAKLDVSDIGYQTNPETAYLSELNRYQMNVDPYVGSWQINYIDNAGAIFAESSNNEYSSPSYVSVKEKTESSFTEGIKAVGRGLTNAVVNLPKSIYKDLTDHPFNPVYHVTKNLEGMLDAASVVSSADANQKIELGTGILATGVIASGIGAGLPRFGMFGKSLSGLRRAESAVNFAAKNHISGLRLKHDLAIERASALSDVAGWLTQETLNNAELIIPGRELGNKNLRGILEARGGNISDWGKYATPHLETPSGGFSTHFYYNPVTNDVYYGMDYKSILGHEGKWNLPNTPKFSIESPKFNKP